MVELFSDLLEVLENIVEIVKCCNIEVQLGKYFLLDFFMFNGMGIDDYLWYVFFEGFEECLEVLLLKDILDYEVKCQVYVDCLNFEFDIIIQMGFFGYFFIVMDFIKWVKNNGVLVGFGWGLGVGLLVVYVLKIIDFDLLVYDLLFECFFNLEWIFMFDFDVDFCMEGCDWVIDYVVDVYGCNVVSQIIIFGIMVVKVVVCDVVWVQGKFYGFVDWLLKMILFEVGMILDKVYEQEEMFCDFFKSDEEVVEIWEMVFKLEGIICGIGKYVGGVVIVLIKLIDFLLIVCDEEGGGLVIQFDKDDVEVVGLVKFDFFGLWILIIIKWVMEIINCEQVKKGLELVNIDFILLDDKLIYLLLQKVEIIVVFQFELCGMKELIKKFKLDCLEDFIVLVVLFCLGFLQLGMVDDFINCKYGCVELFYLYFDYQYVGLELVFKFIYGIILYQEQVMQIVQVMVGYIFGGVDMLCWVMGKKKFEEMVKQCGGFIEGCKNNGIDVDFVGNIFDLVEKFVGYGFNKLYLVVYGLVFYQIVWLKIYFLVLFMVVVFIVDMQNIDKVVMLIEECWYMKLCIVVLDVNNFEFCFIVDDDGWIVYGLGVIKGVGEGLVEVIIECCVEGGLFNILFDFCDCVDLKCINKCILEVLICVGVLDCLGLYYYDELKVYQVIVDFNCVVLLVVMEEVIQVVEQIVCSYDSGYMDLFGGVFVELEVDVYVNYCKVKELIFKECLKGEKDIFGLYLIGYLIDEYEGEVWCFVCQCIVELKLVCDIQMVVGLIVNLWVMKNKKGDKMGFVIFDDCFGWIEVLLFFEVFVVVQLLLQIDVLVVVEGEVSQDDFFGGLCLCVKCVMSLEEVCIGLVESLWMKLYVDLLKGDCLCWLGELFNCYCGFCLIILDYISVDVKVLLQFGESWWVDLVDDLIQVLCDQFGCDNVFFNYC